MSTDLLHFGVKGMRWGVTKSRKVYVGKLIKNAKTANIKKWGKSKDTNILYITGFSGSGKSTVARSLSDNTNVIHIDTFFEKLDTKVASSFIDNEFIAHLKTNMPDYKNIAIDKKLTKDWFNKVDTFMKQTEIFAEKQFSKNKKVIVEGVQLADDTIYPDKNFFKNKPVMILNTSARTSMLRAWDRDDNVVNEENIKQYLKGYSSMSMSMVKLANIIDAQKGKRFVDKYLITK